MASAAFLQALPFVLKWEGGYVNHPADPGGATNKGITQKVYDEWRGRQGLPARSVKELEDSEMHALYESGYWLPPKCDKLDDPLNLVQFDTAVNMGVGRAARFLQQAVGAGVDGSIGPGTLQCVANCDPGDALENYCNTREAYYKNLVAGNPKLGVFLKGWMNRLNALRQQIGLPGHESPVPLDFGDAGYVAKVPDLGEDPAYDLP
ncbi:glycosyl hydrolase 108 family protein [Ideonella sp. DXS22W]|uniref:Glycosyl hydrolase 108 family protein n=1 Tax=Pseudaquabacterium inlustre TaxID=2984192 RepID=A0ABU9CGH1_9BURK